MVSRYVPNLLNDCGQENVVHEASHKVGNSEFGLLETGKATF